MKSRVVQLGYELTDVQVKEVTAKIKQMGDSQYYKRDLLTYKTDRFIQFAHWPLTIQTVSFTRTI